MLQTQSSLPKFVTTLAREGTNVMLTPKMKRERVASISAVTQKSSSPIIDCARKYGSVLVAHMIDNVDIGSLAQFLTVYTIDIHQKFRGISHILRAISTGNLEIVKLIDGNYKKEEHQYYDSKIKTAIMYDRLEILEYYYSMYNRECDYYARHLQLIYAIEHGRFEITKWMHEHEYVLYADCMPNNLSTNDEMKEWMANASLLCPSLPLN